MYRPADEREGVDFDVNYLPTDKRSWPYSWWLMEQWKQWKYLRRVLRKVRCVNPETGELDVLFAELCDDSEPRFPESDQCRLAFVIRQEFFEDGQNLERCMCDALAMINGKQYIALLDSQQIDHETKEACLKFASETKNFSKDRFWVYQLLTVASEINYILDKWMLELDALRSEERHLAVWRYHSSRAGASKGGRQSGATRAKQVRLTPETAKKLFADFELGGMDKRAIAAVIAKRKGLTSDHVRRLLKK